MSEHGNFSIRIVDTDSDPIAGAKVAIMHFGLMGGYEDQYTDDEGWVTFERHSHTPNITDVYVNGESVDTDISPDDGETYSYTIS